VRVVLASVGDMRVPGVRQRALKLLECVRRRGHEVELVKPLVASTAPRLSRRLARVPELVRLAVRARRADVVILYRLTLPAGSAPLLRRLASRVVFDFDDAIFLPAPSEPRDEATRRRYQRRFAQTVRVCDLVTAGNRLLAESCEARHIEVVPTPIDMRQFNPEIRREQLGRQRVIGWVGTGENLPQWQRLIDVFRAVQARHPAAVFKVVCDRPPSPIDLPLTFERWAIEREASCFSDIDIGIMPLEDTEWNRGKCAFKALQCMAIGIPVVVSPVGVNTEVVEHGVNGFLATSEQEWVEALSRLIADPTLGAQMGAAAHRSVERSYALSVVGSRFAALIESLAGVWEQRQ
jgi:glycosyltransferase involved in cell wall biosynthesis